MLLTVRVKGALPRPFYSPQTRRAIKDAADESRHRDATGGHRTSEYKTTQNYPLLLLPPPTIDRTSVRHAVYLSGWMYRS